MSITRKAQKVLAAARHKELRRALRYAVAPAIEHNALLRSLPPLSSIVDVGANKGQFALVARRIHSAAHITAFEPLAKAASRFSTIFREDHQVTIHQIAIGESSTEAEFHVSGRDDSSSLLAITDLQEATFPGTKQRRIEQVQVRPLADLLDASNLSPPALIKIDVQGAELDVLKGIGELLPHFDYLCVEVSFVEFYANQPLAHEVLSYLSNRGFILNGVYNAVLNKRGQSVQSDFLFINSHRNIQASVPDRDL